MSYKLKVAEANVFGKGKFVNYQGNTECVEFVKKAANAPQSILWKKGKKVSDAKFGEIPRGTAIATFDSNGKYPTDALGKHAAIYIEHNSLHITVLDQWNDLGEVKQRNIRFNRPSGTKRNNDANTYYVIESN